MRVMRKNVANYRKWKRNRKRKMKTVSNAPPTQLRWLGFSGTSRGCEQTKCEVWT